jgi:hypothetical protein
MAFTLATVNRSTSGANSNAPTCWTYTSATDDGATIAAANYFDDFATSLQIGHQFFVRATDGYGFYVVTAVTPNVTTSALATIGVGGVGSANLQAGAVDTAAIADAAVTSAKLDPTTLQYALTTISAAQWNGMYAAPKEIIAAPAAGELIIVDQAMLVVDYGGAAFAAGGVFGLQYDTTANGAGTAASATAAAAVAQWAADSTLLLAGACPTSAATTTVAKSICMSNLTAAFTTGTSVVDCHIWYRIVPAGL